MAAHSMVGQNSTWPSMIIASLWPFSGIGRPNLLITDAYNAIYNQQKRKQRDENLVSKLLSTVRDGGDVMIVIDTGGRILEIAHLLDQLWQK